MGEKINQLSQIGINRYSLYDAEVDKGHLDDPSIQFLALPGGGVAGAAFGGVIQELENRGYRKNIKYWLGSSAGAICSAFAAMGASSDYMIDKLVTTDKKLFLDLSLDTDFNGNLLMALKKYRVGITELINKLGISRGCHFHNWFENAMWECGWSPETTFSDIYQKTGRHLCITGTSLNTYETLYFSRCSYPYMKVSDAVQISMSLPFIFQPILMADPMITEGKRILTDGAILDSLPLNACDIISPSGEILAFNRKAVGFMLVSGGRWVPPYVPIDGLARYSLTFIESLRNRINVFQSHQPYYWSRVVPIETYGIGTVDFGAGPEAMKRLVQSGQESASLYLDRREAMIKKWGPLPRNIFIPNYRLRCQGKDWISNELIDETQIYQTNPEKFGFNWVPLTENYHLWS